MLRLKASERFATTNRRLEVIVKASSFGCSTKQKCLSFSFDRNFSFFKCAKIRWGCLHPIILHVSGAQHVFTLFHLLR